MTVCPPQKNCVCFSDSQLIKKKNRLSPESESYGSTLYANSTAILGHTVLEPTNVRADADSVQAETRVLSEIS